MLNNIEIMPALGIATWTIVLLVIIVLIIAALIGLSIYGKKLQTKQSNQPVKKQVSLKEFIVKTVIKYLWHRKKSRP